MAISQQAIHAIEVMNLKNLNRLKLSFEGKPVTAILGPNGNGKSTILHALACAFRPGGDGVGENYKFSAFFLPNTDALWNGSRLTINHSFREGATVKSVAREYFKTDTRWTPRYENRPIRDVFYIGIDKCVPLIEIEKKQARINYSTQLMSEGVIGEILSNASYILNRKYKAINKHKSTSKTFIGVEIEGLRYSALSMSAGEQKVFYILEKIFRAPKYSLILIDELDLLLHDSALKKLIDVMNTRAAKQSLQIVFTTHRETVLDCSNIINIRHIYNEAGQTLCFEETKPDAITRLTGQGLKPIEVFVEDDLSEAIINKLAQKYKAQKLVSVKRFGAAINAFTLVAGLILKGEDCENSLFVLDGDVYASEKEKIERINCILTGNHESAILSREKALKKLSQYNLPENKKPEEFIHACLCSFEGEPCEVIGLAREIYAELDSHRYIDKIIEGLGVNRAVGLSRVIDVFSQTQEWDAFIEPVDNWMKEKVKLFEEV